MIKIISLLFGIILFLPNISLGALTDNLISYWSLDDLTDEVTTNDLTNNNSATFTTGKIDNGVDLESGSSQYLSITDASQTGLDITGDMSINVWVKFESHGGFDAICSKWGTSGQASFIFGYDPGGSKLRFWYNDSGSNDRKAEVSWSPDLATWYHIVMVFDASAHSTEMFVNGSSIGSGDGTGTSIFSGTSPFNVGSRGTIYYLFDGLIDELGIWDRLLTTSEVISLYGGGNGLAYPLTSNGEEEESGTVASSTTDQISKNLFSATFLFLSVCVIMVVLLRI